MKTIPSILIVIAALSNLSLAGCEYHDYATLNRIAETPDAEVLPSQPAEMPSGPEEITAPSEEEAVEETDVANADDPDEGSPDEEEDGDFSSILMTRHDPKLVISPDSAEDLAARLRGERDENSIADRIHEAAQRGPLTLDSRPKQYIVSLEPPFRQQGSTPQEGGISREGTESSAGYCDPLDVEIGAGFTAARAEDKRGGIQPILNLSLDCRGTWNWADPFASVTPELQSRWEEDIRHGEIEGDAFSMVGRALKGFRLFRCWSSGIPGGQSLDDAFCGVEGLFVPVRPDGAVVSEAGGLIFPDSAYDYSTIGIATVQCQGPDEVVTGMKIRRSKSHQNHDETLRWIEITCSRIVK